MREGDSGRRLSPRHVASARRWRCRARDVGECWHSVPAERMIRRAAPIEWYRCTAGAVRLDAAGALRADEHSSDPLTPEQPGSGRSVDDDDPATTLTWSTFDLFDEPEA